MQTNLATWIKDTAQGVEADAILRKCVHCGFCLATCPTYNLLGDELDSPRGRIYLMKQMLEGAPVTVRTQLHLDRCLTCRACETTCPSGVEYGRLVDIGREMVEQQVPRSVDERLFRALLRRVVTSTALFGLFLDGARVVRPLLPRFLARKITKWRSAGEWPSPRHVRRMIILDGCVQPAMAPSINAATARILDRIGIAVTWAPQVACCGAVEQHLNEHAMALARVRSNIDAWWPLVEAGAEAIVITASGCATMVAEYGHLLRDDALYATRAARISSLVKDVSEVIEGERGAIAKLLARGSAGKVAFHSPCSLQHGLKIKGVVESILREAGFTLTAVPDGHLCCGSAGTYSILQPKLSGALRENKVKALESGQPDLIATANIGCLAHIAGGTDKPVRHWIELLEERLTAAP